MILKDDNKYLTLSVIVPTYNEIQNLPKLIKQINQIKSCHNLKLELLIVDDNSRDGTEELVREYNQDWIHLHVRKSTRSLSLAVCEGLEKAKGQILLVMDADLSHPPEMIPFFLEELQNGFDFVIGSRYIEGGTTSEDWGILRWLNSRLATLLARPFTDVKDPMSGFFALSRETFRNAAPLDPVGYKIGLELLVKCRCRKIKEIPIHFENRKFGTSKLTLRQQISYIKHIVRLLKFKYGPANT